MNLKKKYEEATRQAKAADKALKESKEALDSFVEEMEERRWRPQGGLHVLDRLGQVRVTQGVDPRESRKGNTFGTEKQARGFLKSSLPLTLLLRLSTELNGGSYPECGGWSVSLDMAGVVKYWKNVDAVKMLGAVVFGTEAQVKEAAEIIKKDIEIAKEIGQPCQFISELGEQK